MGGGVGGRGPRGQGSSSQARTQFRSSAPRASSRDCSCGPTVALNASTTASVCAYSWGWGGRERTTTTPPTGAGWGQPLVRNSPTRWCATLYPARAHGPRAAASLHHPQQTNWDSAHRSTCSASEGYRCCRDVMIQPHTHTPRPAAAVTVRKRRELLGAGYMPPTRRTSAVTSGFTVDKNLVMVSSRVGTGRGSNPSWCP
jgi:hypothetical protein